MSGTLAWLDATVVSIEGELQLEPTDEKLEFVFVDDEVVEAFPRGLQPCRPSIAAAAVTVGRIEAEDRGQPH